MDSITFSIGDVTIQLCNGEASFWIGLPDHAPDIVLPIETLNNALSAARMLIKEK